MHKRVFEFFIGTIFILIVLAWVDGALFKRNFYHVVDLINEDNRFKIDVIAYHEGILASHALLRVTILNKNLTKFKQLNVPELKLNVPITFILREHILHGPLIYTKKYHNLQVGYASLHSNVITENTQKELVKLVTLAGFNNQWSGHFYTNLLSFSIPGFEKVTIAGLEGEYEINMDENLIRRVISHLQTGAILFEGDQHNKQIKAVSIEPLKSRYIAVFQQKGLWSGSSSTYTPKMIITKPNNDEFVFEKFAINTTFSLGQLTFYSTNLAIYVDHLISPTHTLPAFSKLQIRVVAKNFNAGGIDKYITMMKSKSPEELKDIKLKTIESILAQTITQTSILQGFITSDTSLGRFSYHSKTFWPPNIPLPNTIEDAIKNSQTMIKIKMTKTLVVKLLSIYGDEIMASNDERLAQIKKKDASLAKEYFKNQQTENGNEFQRKVEDLVKEKLISIPLSLQLLAFEKAHLTLADFIMNLDQLNISGNIKQDLKLAYQNQLEHKEEIITSDKITHMISDLLAISYLKKDGNDYLTEISIEHGIFIINGSPVLPKSSAVKSK